MSLINRMLRDLASRQPPSGEMLSGIQLAQPGANARPPTRWGLLAAFAIGALAIFVGVRPLLVKRAALPVPTARNVPTSLQAAAAPPPQAAVQSPPPAAASPAPANAPLEAHPAQPAAPRLHYDTKLSGSAGKGPARPHASRPKPRAHAPEAKPADQHEAPSSAPAVAEAKPAERHEAPSSAPVQTQASRNAEASVQRTAQGTAGQAAGQVKSAEQEFREALALNPSNHDARERLARLLIDQGRLREARPVLDDGLLLEPMRNGYRRLAARLDLALDAPSAAVQRLEPLPPSVAEDSEYHGLLAAAYQRLGLHEAAAREYENLLKVQPDDGNWWAGYGISKEALGATHEALDAYARARQVGRLDPRVRDYIAQRSAALQAPKD